MLCKSVDCWQASLLITNYKRSSCIHKFAIDVAIYINNLTYTFEEAHEYYRSVWRNSTHHRWQTEFLVAGDKMNSWWSPARERLVPALLLPNSPQLYFEGWGIKNLKKKEKKKQPLVASVDSVCRSLNPKCQAPISVGSHWLPWLVIVSWSLTSKPTKKYKYISSFAKRVSNSQIKQYHDNREVLPNSPCTDLHLLLWYQLTANTEPIYGWSQPFEGTEHWRFHW